MVEKIDLLLLENSDLKDENIDFDDSFFSDLESQDVQNLFRLLDEAVPVEFLTFLNLLNSHFPDENDDSLFVCFNL